MRVGWRPAAACVECKDGARWVDTVVWKLQKRFKQGLFSCDCKF